MEGLHNSQFILSSQQLLPNVNAAVCDTASISIEKPQEHAAEELPPQLIHTQYCMQNPFSVFNGPLQY